MHFFEVQPRSHKRGVELISDLLPFRRLWYGEPNTVHNGIRLCEAYSRSHRAVIPVYSKACRIAPKYVGF
jgi:hypothetical protein